MTDLTLDCKFMVQFKPDDGWESWSYHKNEEEARTKLRDCRRDHYYLDFRLVELAIVKVLD